MRKSVTETARKPASLGSYMVPVLFGGGVCLLVLMLAALVLAGLIWGGVLPEGNTSMILMLFAGLGALIGGRFAVQKGRGQVLLLGFMTAVLFCAVVVLIGGGVTGSPAISGKSLGTLLMILAGGSLAGLMGRTRKIKKRR